jgi:2,3-bisphosphoglycerate-dependent phosphoglycerate mutase
MSHHPKSLYLFISIAFTAVLAISCRQEAKQVSVNGKFIREVLQNTIITRDSQQLVLPEDSIAKIYYLVRHAEKDTSIKDEPPLTQEGLERAARIADILKGTRIDAIYSTITMRTMLTVDSLADIKAMKILPYDNKGLKPLLDDIKNSTENNRVMIVGHGNTIPSITNTLAGRDVFKNTFAENEYDNFIIVVTRKSGQSDVYTLKY